MPANNSFKPTPCRGASRVLYATQARVRRPATGRLNSGVRPHMKYFLYSILAFVLVSHSHAFGAESPARTVENFYAWAIHPAPEDQGKGITPARSFFSQELLAALEAQRNYEKSCARLVPANIKPYMLDQSPFFSAPDGAKSLESTRTVAKGNTARTFARLAYDDFRWIDTVVLRREQGRWVILDIEWQDGGSLTKRLADFCKPQVCALTIRSSRPRIVASATCLRYASTRPPPRCGAA